MEAQDEAALTSSAHWVQYPPLTVNYTGSYCCFQEEDYFYSQNQNQQQKIKEVKNQKR